MIPTKNSAYVQSLLRMASGYARGMSPSIIMAVPLDARSYLKEFADKVRIPGEELEPLPLNESLSEILYRWVDEGKGFRSDKTIGKWLGKLINRRMGEPKLIAGLREDAGLPENLSCEENSTISRTQGVFFAVYKDGVLCFMKGKTKA